MRILIAEDDPVSRRLLRKTLEDWGHEVVAAADGREAWDRFRELGVKFVIADWIMPELDGIALCRRIRAEESGGYVYFILLTGKDRRADIVEGLEAGADDYVAKPFDREEMRVRVRAGERILNLERELVEKNAILVSLNSRLEALACMDPLMEIGNRRSFHENIQRVSHRSVRYRERYGIIMCDIDAFKAYNDTYGHIAGDQILRTTAAAIKSVLRTSDELYRYGGEEIVVVLPREDPDGILKLAARIRKAVEDLGIEHRGSPSGRLTVSCGAAVCGEDTGAERWVDVLERADRALYKAKETGRNRVEYL